MNSNFTSHNYLIKFDLITLRRKFINSELANLSPGVFAGPLEFRIKWGPQVTSHVTSLVILMMEVTSTLSDVMHVTFVIDGSC